MKYLSIIFLFLSLNCFSQSDSTSFISFDTSYSRYRELVEDGGFEVFIETDSAGMPSSNPSDLLIYGDTACVIITLFQQQYRTWEVLNAAEDILSYIQLNGHITNWRKFRKAAEKYMNLKK